MLERVASGYYGVVQIIPSLGQDSLATVLQDALTNNYSPPKRFAERAVYAK